MTRTRYKINNLGREWYVDEENRDVAQYYSEQGATVTAETMKQGSDGVSITQLSDDQLDNLAQIAEQCDWNHVEHMITDRKQTRVEQ